MKEKEKKSEQHRSKKMSDHYIEFVNESYRIKGSRVSLDSVVYAFQQGLSPETIAAECFPVLTLEQVYGAITYYLANREQIDGYLKQGEALFDDQREKNRKADPAFYEKFMQSCRQTDEMDI